MVVGLGAFGALGYAASDFHHVVSTVARILHIQQPSHVSAVHRPTSALAQYGSTGATTTTGTTATTATSTVVATTDTSGVVIPPLPTSTSVSTSVATTTVVSTTAPTSTSGPFTPPSVGQAQQALDTSVADTLTSLSAAAADPACSASCQALAHAAAVLLKKQQAAQAALLAGLQTKVDAFNATVSSAHAAQVQAVVDTVIASTLSVFAQQMANLQAAQAAQLAACQANPSCNQGALLKTQAKQDAKLTKLQTAALKATIAIIVTNALV
jgi:hypothetical protein